LPEQGKVLHIEDGDSGTLLYRGRNVEFRLYGIDAPELKQNYGKRARTRFAKMMCGKTVEFDILDHDRYGRRVVLTFIDGKCVNEELVKAGHAWVYTHYCRDVRCEKWVKLQELAKKKGIGLWAGRDPLPPWEYRERHADRIDPLGLKSGSPLAGEIP
jgi:endonuclease YncB( thermonuclease family)